MYTTANKALQDPPLRTAPGQSLSIPLSRIMKSLRFCSTDSIPVTLPQSQECQQKTQDSRVRDKRLYYSQHTSSLPQFPLPPTDFHRGGAEGHLFIWRSKTHSSCNVPLSHSRQSLTLYRLAMEKYSKGPCPLLQCR